VIKIIEHYNYTNPSKCCKLFILDPNSWLENTSFVPAIENVPLPPSAEKQPYSRESVSPTVKESSSPLILKRRSRDDSNSSHSHKHKRKKHKKDKKTTEELLENNYGSSSALSR
jgi:hypothetical protein